MSGDLTAKDKLRIVQMGFGKGRDAAKKEQEKRKKRRREAFKRG